MMYEYTDKALSGLNKQYIRLFRRLRLLKFDELNVINHISEIYRKADKAAKNCYLSSGIYGYLFAMQKAKQAGFEVKIPDADKTPIDEDWVLDMLEETDAVTLYAYSPEWERKRQRLTEALAATNKHNAEIDKAMKLLFLQVSHYADKATSKAAIKAYKDAGVKKVMWVTERDEKVCRICGPLDGKIFDIDKVPTAQHYRCRCELIPAL